MAIRPRGSAWQVTLYYQNKRYRRQFEDFNEAKRWETQANTSIKAGFEPDTNTPVEPGGQTMKDVLESCYNRHWRGAKAEQTLYANGKEVVSVVGESRHPNSITTNDVDKVVDTCVGKGNSNATINRKLAAMSKMMRHATDRGWCVKPPKIEKKREAKHRIRFLSPLEETKLLATCNKLGYSDLKDLIVFLVDTGLRLGEALNLDWSRIEMDPATAQCKAIQLDGRDTKNGSARTVPLTARAAALLKKRTTDPVPFGIFSVNVAEYQWNKCRSMMGLEDDKQFVPHACRHTFCTRLAQAGVPIPVIQQLAGHKTIAITMRYAHVAGHQLSPAIKALERTITPLGPVGDGQPHDSHMPVAVPAQVSGQSSQPPVN